MGCSQSSRKAAKNVETHSHNAQEADNSQGIVSTGPEPEPEPVPAASPTSDPEAPSANNGTQVKQELAKTRADDLVIEPCPPLGSHPPFPSGSRTERNQAAAGQSGPDS